MAYRVDEKGKEQNFDGIQRYVGDRRSKLVGTGCYQQGNSRKLEQKAKQQVTDKKLKEHIEITNSIENCINQ
jgi:predicted RNA-binding protein YlxR (DUF448 family)